MEAIVRAYSTTFEPNTESRKISGLASVFYRANDPGTQYELGPNLYERIDPHAFDRTLAEKRVVFLLFNHDQEKVLARSDVNMELGIVPEGLRFTADLNDASWSNDSLALVRGKQLGGCSFKYYPTTFENVKEGKNNIRIVKDGYLTECSIVYQPAYESTAVLARSLQEKSNIDEYEMRLKLLDIPVIQA